ncbi:beta-galactosidase [Jiangella sp. DSM 45060]|uniref:beta-galactosidase n=1 Tax=Jiangella sp. DSM 45060 TaxID=1798224 RepID=UPI00087C0DF7|nr:beta-galactosidase [Jiangella sp. DSM 45060]SDT57125.1 beta-galactosidase [Jiangella sp. DSM 45060]
MTLWFGGDYNPEQWPREVWDEDVRLMRRAGVTVATVGVFSWAQLEPEDGRFEFEWLDDVLGRLHAGGIGVDLATATASPPPWALRGYPDIAPVTADGVRLGGGSRQHYSPHSPSYRRLAGRLVRALAERYGSHPALVAWHVNNEFGCHVSRCYGEHAAVAFRAWLRARYGTVDALNAAWGTAFWSQRYANFDEIEPPRAAPTLLNPTQVLDFDRFSSDALLDLHRAEAAILRELSPGVPVTTNFMGPFRGLDYWRWAEEVDLVSDDSYPDPADPDSPATAALGRDLMRSLAGDRPWVLMEQAPSAVNWRLRNAPKPPGGNRVLSMQALARGADGIMYFQWRQAASGAETFHSAMVPHGGPDTRVYREVEALGAELGELGWVERQPVPARVAIVFDWTSWWALEQPSRPTALSYLGIVTDWYRAFWDRSVTVDFVRPGADLSAYSLVVAPVLFAADAAALDGLHAYAASGGTLAVTFQSGVLDESLHVHSSGYLGPLAATLGVRVEEFAPLAGPPGAEPPDIPVDGELGPLTGRLWSEYTHAEGADVLATFAAGDVAGWPAVTRNTAGAGTAWYVATHPDADGLGRVTGALLAAAGVDGVLDRCADGVEAIVRGDATFLLNHRGEERQVVWRGDELVLGPREVRILKQ